MGIHAKKGEEHNLHHIADTNLLNLNGNLLCAVDVITTGDNPKKDQLYEICVLPLNANFKAHKGIIPFNIMFQINKDKIDLDNLPKALGEKDIIEACLKGTHPYAIADRFEEWYDKIKLRSNKRICPLGYNYLLKQQFIANWLGHKHYNLFFSEAYRDLLSAAIFVNDKCDFHSEEIRYPKYDLQYLFSQNKVEGAVGRYDSLANCISMAECYRRMLGYYL